MKYELEVVNIRLVREPSWYSEVPLRKTKDAAELMAREFADYDREVFCILNLASDGKVINMNIVSMGTLNASLVSPREVFKSSILSNAASIIAVHNHPSGCVNPSKQDKLITQRLREAGGLMDIELLDHIIVGGKNRQYYSFREENILNNNFSQQFVQERYDLDR
jgi:DNA repair protein RadC